MADLPSNVQLFLNAVLDRKAEKVNLLDLRSLEEAVCDFFIICEGTSTTQTRAIAQNVVYESKHTLAEVPLCVEGAQTGEWVVVDLFDVVVHVFTAETRDFYQLEELWSDGTLYSFDEKGEIIV